MFCKSYKSSLFLCVFAVSISTHTSRSILPFLVCVELNVSSHKFGLHVFRAIAPCLNTKPIDASWPPPMVSRLGVVTIPPTSTALYRVDANSLLKHGVNVTREIRPKANPPLIFYNTAERPLPRRVFLMKTNKKRSNAGWLMQALIRNETFPCT